ARVLRGARPDSRVVEVGIEVVEVALIVLVGELLPILDPFVARRQRVETPMDEQPEPVTYEPTGVADGLLRLWNGRHRSPFLARGNGRSRRPREMVADAASPRRRAMGCTH